MGFEPDMFRPPLGVNIAALLAGAALCAAVWLYLRQQRQLSILQRLLLGSLRLAALALLGWLLLGPSAFQGEQDRAAALRLIMLADTSASMAHRDMPASLAPGAEPGNDGHVSRWDVTQSHWLNEALLAQLRSHASVSVIGFDEGIRSLPPSTSAAPDQPVGQATHMFAALDAATNSAESADASPGIVVLISDGHDTQRGHDAGLLARLRQARWPVYAVPLGNQSPVRDVALSAWAESDFLFAGQSTTIHAAITHHGFAGRTANVRLLHEGETLETRRVRLEPDMPAQLQFQVTPPPMPGRPISAHGYQIVVDPLPHEQHEDNNRRWVFLQVSREHIRVALFDAEPYWDTKFLIQALREDPHVDVTGIFSLGPERFFISRHVGAAGQSAPPQLSLPITQQQLHSYDVVILGKGSERFFGGERAAMLVEFVQQHGGALVLARGRAFGDSNEARQAQSLLSLIEPIEWGQSAVNDLRMQLTPAGRASPLLRFEQARSADAILTELPDMIAATRVVREKAASIVLLRQAARQGDDAPMAALAHQNVGAGQVLAVLNEGMWRWAFLPGSMREYDSVYQQFWSRTVRWLATGGEFLPGQSAALSLSKLAAAPGEEVVATVTVRQPPEGDWQPTLQVIGPDGEAQPLTLRRVSDQAHRYVAAVRPADVGVHVVELTAPGMEPQRLTTRLAVYESSPETLDTSARPQTLAAIADATGGQVLAADRPQQLLEIVERLKATRQTEPRVDYLFDRPEVFVALIALFGLEWLLRRRSGVL